MNPNQTRLFEQLRTTFRQSEFIRGCCKDSKPQLQIAHHGGAVTTITQSVSRNSAANALSIDSSATAKTPSVHYLATKEVINAPSPL